MRHTHLPARCAWPCPRLGRKYAYTRVHVGVVCVGTQEGSWGCAGVSEPIAAVLGRKGLGWSGTVLPRRKSAALCTLFPVRR